MKKLLKSAIIGTITGLVNGLFGSGGGTILVPCMQKYLNIETHKSHATAIAIILPLSVLSTFAYLTKLQIDYIVTLLVSIGGVVGSYFGAKFLTKVPKNWLHKIFGIFMIAAAIRMIL